MLKIRKKMGDKGLTLIELLVTIAVLAIVAAIAVPVVTNVVGSTNERVAEQTQSDIADFVEKYNKQGGYTYDPTTGTFSGYADLNGDGTATEDEKIEELVIDLETFEIGGLGEAAPSTVGEIDYDNPTTTTFSIIDYEITASPASVTINGWANNAITPTSVSLENAVGNVTWTVSEGSLPAGLFINDTTGAVTGTPENAVTTEVTIQGTDEQGATISQSHAYEIIQPTLSPSTVNVEEQAGVKLEAPNATLDGFTSPYTWEVTSGTLPAGLSLDSSTGIISGTPSAEGTTSLTLTLTDANGLTATQSHSYEIAEPARVILTSSSPGWAVLDNGVTITCDGASPGDTATFTIDGIETIITKRINAGFSGKSRFYATACTSGMTDFTGLLRWNTTFNDDIGHWDTSSVTDMKRLFDGATAFNQDISNWDTSSVGNMYRMFRSAESFNQDLSGWDVSRVVDDIESFGSDYPIEDFDLDANSWEENNKPNFP